MNLYDKTQKSCEYGSFDTSSHASYTLDNPKALNTPWYYVYSNKKVLLYVDQRGPVKMQYQPPNGILVFKRELGEVQSKWQVWISSPELNGGVAVSNFNNPVLRRDLEVPKFKVNWTPEVASYVSEYNNARIATDILVPSDKATVCMKTTVTNTSGKAMDFCVYPSVFPYVNIPQMVAWDLPEWYLSTAVKKCDNMLTFHGQMTDPGMRRDHNRSVTYNVNYDDSAGIVLDMASFCGSGSFFDPDIVLNGDSFPIKMSEADGKKYTSYQAVYSAKYKFTLNPGESKTLTQVMTIQDSFEYSAEENDFDKVYFTDEGYNKRYLETKAFYDGIFSKRKIESSNKIYDSFINEFTPLQMLWVSSLDRGWPSSMRGVRDASQDFIGTLCLDPKWTRDTILSMFAHQRRDGWMPRQISTVSREAPHDMRYYSDGGAFLLELMHEYLAFTRDTTILDEKLYWLDSDEKSTVLEHIIECTAYYLRDENIGEHGLCKVWFGDWWDPMDDIGTEGRGETVTVSCQMIINLKNLSNMLNWLMDIGKIDKSYSTLSDKYNEYAEKFKAAVNGEALNPMGYYNGYFNDNGKWLFSDNDPDGEDRMYLVSNSWAMIAGCGNRDINKNVVSMIEKNNLRKLGYAQSNKGFPVPIEKAGRIGLGITSCTNPYNHGQSFYVRGLCTLGAANKAYDVTRYILPIEEEYAPVKYTCAPPYAIANAYSGKENSLHRVQFQFLSGTVSYVLRTVYNFFGGICFDYKGLWLKPCVPDAFGDFKLSFTYLNSEFTVYYKKISDKDKVYRLNGRELETKIDSMSKLAQSFIPDGDFEKENVIEIEY